jgi:ubiquitin-protein ligase
MYESPRIRRLRNDLTALNKLRAESSVFEFQATGNPPHHYLITFKGKGLCRDRGKIRVIYYHRVEIKLGVSYPRSIPELRWVTPVYHPNISEIGMVCLGGYGTHWVPSVQLDELCMMLWDMARYFNYDIRSPYNRDAALWVANQTSILFPTDSRPLRDLRMAQGRIEVSNVKIEGKSNGSTSASESPGQSARAGRPPASASVTRWDILSPVNRVRQFVERYARAAGEVSTQRTNVLASLVNSERSPLGAAGPSTTPGNEGATTAVGGSSDSAAGQDEAGIEVRETLSGHANGDQGETELRGQVVLDPESNGPARPEGRTQAEDEIVFIE